MIVLDTNVVSEVLKPTPNGRGLADLSHEQSMRKMDELRSVFRGAGFNCYETASPIFIM